MQFWIILYSPFTPISASKICGWFKGNNQSIPGDENNHRNTEAELAWLWHSQCDHQQVFQRTEPEEEGQEEAAPWPMDGEWVLRLALALKNFVSNVRDFTL